MTSILIIACPLKRRDETMQTRAEHKHCEAEGIGHAEPAEHKPSDPDDSHRADPNSVPTTTLANYNIRFRSDSAGEVCLPNGSLRDVDDMPIASDLQRQDIVL